MIHLDETDLVGNIQSVDIGSKADIGFFVTIGSDQSVNLLDTDTITSLDSFGNLSLVGFDITDEYQCIVCFNLFHGRFGIKRELNNAVWGQAGSGGNGFAGIFAVTGKTKSLWAAESSAGANFAGAGSVGTLKGSFASSLSFTFGGCGFCGKSMTITERPSVYQVQSSPDTTSVLITISSMYHIHSSKQLI